MPRRHLAAILVTLAISMLLTACGPKADFDSFGAKRDPKPLDAPVAIYPADYTLLNNAEIIGRITINGGSLPTGCELEDSFAAAKHKARKVGGNAVQITTLLRPASRNECWGLEGYVFTLVPPPAMPTIPIAGDTIRAHIDSLPTDSNSITGIWRIDEAQIWRQPGAAPEVYRMDGLNEIAIVPSEDSTFAYDGIVVQANDPGWQPGFVKTRLGTTDDPNVFVGQWYQSDFTPVTVMMTRDKEVRMGFTLKGEAGHETVEYKVTLFRLYPSR